MSNIQFEEKDASTDMARHGQTVAIRFSLFRLIFHVFIGTEIIILMVHAVI